MLQSSLLKSMVLYQGFFMAAFIPQNDVFVKGTNEKNQSLKDSSSLIKDSICSIAHLNSIPINLPDVPYHTKAKMASAIYIKKNLEALEKIKKYSGAQFKAIDLILTQQQLPLQLKYLAVVESEMKSKAVSRVGAAGLWQLMPSTAKFLGLKVNAKNDERKHLHKSTVAAAIYLRDLYKEFDDWLLVIAAYNGGPGTVYKAIKKSGSRNFWVLQQYLPEESRLHVKRFIGAQYFFEGKGSITTLTKGEWNNYVQKMDKVIAVHQQMNLLDTKPMNTNAIATTK